MIEVILAMCAIGLYIKFGLELAMVERFLFVFLLICLAYIDLDTFFLPYSLLLALFVVGIFSTALYGLYPAHYMAIGKPFFWLDFMVLPKKHFLWDRIAGALLGAFLLISINIIATYFLRRSKRLLGEQWAMGFGDALLIFVIGLFVGASHLILVLFLASAAGSIFGILYRFFPIINRPVDEDIAEGALPYGPFLALAAIYVYLL
jgi:leader peptidase (prepilin peptidase) / N-methyltransferase